MSRFPAATIGGVLAVLLVVGAGLFVVGVVAERHGRHHDEPAATATPTGASTVESGNEAAEHTATSTVVPAAETGGHAETAGERVLGVDVESPGLVAAAVAASLALAALVWRRRNQAALVAVVVFAGIFAVVDIAEVAHQVGESRPGVALVAGLVAVVHVAVVALAVLALARPAPKVARPAVA